MLGYAFLLAGALGLVVSPAVAVVAWGRRDTSGAVTLAAMMVCSFVWIAVDLSPAFLYPGGLGLPVVSVPGDRFAASVFVQRLVYFGVTASTITWIVFTAQYSGRESLIDWRTAGLLAVEPVVVNLAIWLRPGLIWAEVAYDPGSMGGLTVVSHGPLFWVHAVYSYLLILVGIYFLINTLYHSQTRYRGQAAAVMAGGIAPLVGNAAYLSGVTSLDLTPVGITAAGVAFSYAMFRFDFMDLAPVARDTVVENIEDGVFVLDDDDRVVDVNPQGRRILGTDPGEILGEQLWTVLPDEGGLADRYEEVDRIDEVIAADVDGERRYYDVEVTPLEDGHGNRHGRVFLVHDVTDQERRQRELERQNEQLDQFASLVSHDLRNPLNVADGYLGTAMEVADDEALESYLAEVAESHDRMNELIADVLTLAREGRTVEETVPVDIGDLARTAWNNVDTGPATLSVETGATVAADEQRCKRLFENLFRNAVEHGTPDGGDDDLAIRVGTLDGESDLRGFYVEDDGQGIPEEKRDEVLKDGFTTSDEGTGLGLSIVRSVVEAHGWSIRVTDAEDGGARFEVTGVGVAPEQSRTESGRTARADGVE